MMQHSWKAWSNFMCPLGPFLLAWSQIQGNLLQIHRYFSRFFNDSNNVLYLKLSGKYSHSQLRSYIIFTFTITLVRLKGISSIALTVITTYCVDTDVGTVSIVIKTLIYISTYWQRICMCTYDINKLFTLLDFDTLALG